MLAIHDKAVKFVLPGSSHHLIEFRQIIRIQLCHYLTAQIHVLLIVGMDILFLVGFNKVVAFLSNDNRALF